MTDADRRIRSFEISALDLPLLEPFGIAGGTQVRAENVLVRVTLADGTVGHGEAAPLPAYNGETQQGTLEALAEVAGAVEGADAGAWRALGRRLRELVPAAGAARCAIETAVLDALLRQGGLSMHAFFGGAERTLETDVTIPTGSEEGAWNAARRWAKAGFRTFKVKVGAADLEGDIARVAAVRDAAPEAGIFLDANASMREKDAISLLMYLRERGIEILLFEQPTPAGDWAALHEVARHVTVAADESVVTAADALLAARLGPPHLLNIKIMKAGIAEALDVAAVGRAAGLGLMIGGNVESILAMSASACLAAGQGRFSQIDLDTPLFFAKSPFLGGFTMRGALIDLHLEAKGHGVSPAPAP